MNQVIEMFEDYMSCKPVNLGYWLRNNGEIAFLRVPSFFVDILRYELGEVTLHTQFVDANRVIYVQK